MSKWTGDLTEDCFLQRYEYRAHVERMDRGVWWFAVDRVLFDNVEKGIFPGSVQIYNTANNETWVSLTTGKTARAAAEIVIELLKQKLI